LPAVIAISMALSHSDHMPNGGVQSSMVFPDERPFYTARNVNSDSITEREEDLSERILTLLKAKPTLKLKLSRPCLKDCLKRQPFRFRYESERKAPDSIAPAHSQDRRIGVGRFRRRSIPPEHRRPSTTRAFQPFPRLYYCCITAGSNFYADLRCHRCRDFSRRLGSHSSARRNARPRPRPVLQPRSGSRTPERLCRLSCTD